MLGVGAGRDRGPDEAVPAVVADRRELGAADVHLVHLVADVPAVVEQDALPEILERLAKDVGLVREVLVHDRELRVSEPQQAVRAPPAPAARTPPGRCRWRGSCTNSRRKASGPPICW